MELGHSCQLNENRLERAKKNAYYITEVQNLKTKLKKAKLKYKFGSFTGIAMP